MERIFGIRLTLCLKTLVLLGELSQYLHLGKDVQRETWPSGDQCWKANYSCVYLTQDLTYIRVTLIFQQEISH